MITNNKTSIKIFLAFLSIYLIWGSTFLAISYGLKGFPPFILSGLRFLIAGCILLFWQKYKGHPIGTVNNWKKNGIIGVLILTGGTGLVAWGEQFVSSTEAAIAIATGPFWFIFLDKKNWKIHFSKKAIVSGLIIGFVGLILFLKGSLTSIHSVSDTNSRVLAFIVLALSSISWVLGSLYSKNNPANQSTFMNIAQQLIVAGFMSIIIASFRQEWEVFNWSEIPISSWFGLLFLIFFGSIIAYISYIWLLSIKEPILVSTHTYINPIVAVLMGFVIANESIHAIQFIGLSIILIGVLLTNSSNYKLGKRQKVKLRRTNQILIRITNPYKYITQ